MVEEGETVLGVCVMCYFLSAKPQAGYLHPELSIRIKVANIQMINLASQSQAPIMPDHFYVALLSPAHTQYPIHADVPL